MRCTTALFVLLAVGGAGLEVHAHHAFTAEFDGNKPVTLKGMVSKVEWINPHSWLTIGVTDAASGKVESWKVEMGAPNQLLRRGWNKNTLPVGSEVVVEGYRAKNGSNVANGGSVTLADGRQLFVGSSGTGAPYDKK
jgi:uncharacterized protein DUF6152